MALLSASAAVVLLVSFLSCGFASAAECPNEPERVGASGLLPDCRAYEQVSPENKYGNDAGNGYAWATADGDRILYRSRGPMGEAHRGIQNYTIGRRLQSGWTAEAALPGGSQEHITALSYGPRSVLPSLDLSMLAFTSSSSFVPANPITSYGTSGALYLSPTEETEEIDWVSKPLIAEPEPAPGELDPLAFQPAGGSPDLRTLYFAGYPTLLPQDAERSPETEEVYEYANGALRSAGTLPDGTLDPHGATPANTTNGPGRNAAFAGGFSPDDVYNQVSADGSLFYFLSPDPLSGEPPQLYVRHNGHSSLVSHAVPGGEPAPSGVVSIPPPSDPGFAPTLGQFVFGAEDGGIAYFRSADALTADAPDDGEAKLYRYDVGSGSVSFVPGVTGTIAAASADGMRFLFGNQSEIAVWDHGSIHVISGAGPGTSLAPARATASGSEFVFSTSAPISGFAGGNAVQIYRYDLATEGTICVSCPPAGVQATGAAELGRSSAEGQVRATRGFSDDGNRVFFDSPDPLVGSDTNGVYDVYEWSDGGGLALISTGHSPFGSYFLDSSGDGRDVFFSTVDGILPSDTDGASDVYDARVGGGFSEEAPPTCAGESCLDPPSGPPALPSPGSGVSRRVRQLPDGSQAAKLRVGSRNLDWDALNLRIAVPRPGTVSARGAGLRPTRRHFGSAGSFKLVVPLTRRAKEALRNDRRLTLKVHLDYAPRSGRPSSVELRFAGRG